MKNKRDLLIIAGLFLALILFVAFGPQTRDTPSAIDAPTTHSSAPTGAEALYRWTDAMGYDAHRLEYREFTLAEEDTALVILNPSQLIPESQVETILDWVERGGTLIFADDSSIAFGGSNQLFRKLSIDRRVYANSNTIQHARPHQPALDQPPIEKVTVQTGRVLVPRRDDYTTLLGTSDAILALGIKHGRGYIYLSSATYPFTNAGLRDPQNARFVLNLFRRVPVEGRILFDEYHHGFFTPPSTSSVLLSTPWGWAASYAMLAIVAYLLLSGRRFGRPIPLKEEIVLRSSAEYVESMADLFQRGGKRAFILRHYYTAFKRNLARPYGINPQLDDPAFVQELARLREVDEPRLLALLARLREDQVSESILVQVVNEADRFLAELRSTR